MRGVRIPFGLLGVLVALAGLSPAVISATRDAEDLRTLAPVLKVQLKEWLAAWRVVRPGFRIEQFTKGSTWSGTLKGPGQGVDLKSIENDPLRAFYAVSPDGRWMVDPYGGVALIKPSNEPNLWLNAGPDTGVHLIDRKLSLLREILSCGTTCGFHEAVWVSKDTFFVAGYIQGRPKRECSDGFTHGPTLYSATLSTNASILYRYVSYNYVGPESCDGVGVEYVIQKIRKKIPNVKY